MTTVEVAKEELPGPESNKLLASYVEYTFRKAIWFVRRTRDGEHRSAMKIVWGGHTIVAVECFLLHESVHFHSDEMWLPKSYVPYADSQYWMDLSTLERDEQDSKNLLLWGGYTLKILGGLGYELISDNDTGTIDLDTLALRRCKIGDFDKMRGNTIAGEQPKELVVPNVALPEHTLRKAIIFAGSYHGKTTAMEAGIAFDFEASAADQQKFVEDHGEIYTEEARALATKWQKVSDTEDSDPKRWFESDDLDAYSDGVSYWIDSELPVIVSHLNEDLLNAAREGNRAVLFTMLDWSTLVQRMDADDKSTSGIRRLAHTGYMMNVRQLSPKGPFFGSVEEAIAEWRAGPDSEESDIPTSDGGSQNA